MKRIIRITIDIDYLVNLIYNNYRGLNMEEVWETVPYAKYYKISNNGNVRRIGKNKNLKQFLQDGYPAVCLSIDCKINTYMVHKLVLDTFIGPKKESEVCRHLDGNKLNNNLDNLKWGTNMENHLDMISHGKLDICKNSFITNRKTLSAKQLDILRWAKKLEEFKILEVFYRLNKNSKSLGNWFISVLDENNHHFEIQLERESKKSRDLVKEFLNIQPKKKLYFNKYLNKYIQDFIIG